MLMIVDRQKMKRSKVIVIGAGFGGLYAAKSMKKLPVDVLLLDKRNYHLFQPLLYQVATGGLSPGDIASPIRGVVSRCENVNVYYAEARDIDPVVRSVATTSGDFHYDILVLASGSDNHYFGNEGWRRYAPGLKSIEDATDIRRRILRAFELAEREPDPHRRKELLRFVVIGGGPTGVELCGAIAELAKVTMKGDFRNIDPAEAMILLVEGSDRILPSFPPELSRKAAESLDKLGVTIRIGTLATQIGDASLTLKSGDAQDELKTGAILWAAGVRVNKLGAILSNKLNLKTDKSGRIVIEPDLSVPGHPEIFIIGDLACYSHQGGKPLPGLAPVAMQQGKYLAKVLESRIKSRKIRPFRYVDKGTLAVIGRNAAVADFGKLRFSGFSAWLLWVFVHIAYLIEYDNKLLVLFQWAWDYFTRKRGARLITWEDELLADKAGDIAKKYD